MFNILAPELIVQVSGEEYISAKIGERKIEDEEWILAHSFFADMGGFRIPVRPTSFSVSDQSNEANQESEQRMNSDVLEENNLQRG